MTLPRPCALFFFTGIIMLAVNSCAPLPPKVPSKADRVMFQWFDQEGPGKVTVSIDLSEQVATVYRGGEEIGWSYVATGKEGRATTPGSFYVMEKIVDKHSNLYGWIEDELGQVTDDDASPGDPVPRGQRYMAAPMPYWMRLTSYGIGMHEGRIPNPGEPASHGCIRMPKDFVPTLFDKVSVGTPVKIVY